MIKNSSFVYGMPQTGKSTLLVRQYLKDKGKDLPINLWTFLHKDPKHAKTATLGFIHSANGNIRALRLPYNPNNWIPAISIFHKAHPKIKRALIDECQCVSAVLLLTLVMTIRDFYPNVPILFTSIDFDSWHHRFPNINYLIDNTEESKHLNHKCIFCHRVATRRLHIMDNKPMYNEKKYNYRLDHHKYHRDGKPMLISVCSRHYRNPPKDLKHEIALNNKKYMGNPKQRKSQIRRALGLGKNTKINFK